MAEGRTVPGVLEKDFTDDVWNGIATAYFRSALQIPETEHVSPGLWYYRSAGQILDGGGEYRYGSLITMHSKLRVCDYTLGMLHFGFYANADPNELAYAQRHGVSPENIQADFQHRVRSFLGGLGLVQEISTCIDIR